MLDILLVVSNCQKLHVRDNPRIAASKILFTIPCGTRVVVDGIVDDWFHIYLVDDPKKEGYINAQYVKEI